VWRGFYHEFNFLHNLGYSPLVAILLFAAPIVYRRLRKKQKPSAALTRTRSPRVLVVYSRPTYLYEMLGTDPKKAKKVKRPTGLVEHKPEVVTDVEPDSSIIQRVFDEAGKRVLLRSLQDATKSDLASALREEWDIVHFDCVVGPQGQLMLDDGEIDPQTLRELLINKNIGLLVLMDCDSLKVVSSASSAGVSALVAVTGSLPVLAAEKFCYGLYRGIALNHHLGDAFTDAKALAAVELTSTWDSTLFVLDGDSQFRIGG
jgi:hypothetical protein